MKQKLREIRSTFEGRFKISEVIGSGGASIVYRANDAGRDAYVALKILKPEIARAIGPERFFREIDFAASLTHPNIVQLLEWGQLDEYLFYTMPFIEGDSLEKKMASEGPLQIKEAIWIASQVASALDYAHGRGIIHRDISPGNILVDGNRTMVTDFGFARALDQGGSPLTPSGLVVGTPTYMCPEQSVDPDKISPASDIYALGCVLYEMLVGEPPFNGPTPQAVMAKHAAEKPRSIRIVRPEVSEDIEAAVMGALEKKPEDRPGSGVEMIALAGPSAMTVEGIDGR